MDIFLGKVTQQAMNYAIRSGITLTATYAIKQSNKLLRSSPKSTARDELFDLQQKLQHKVRIVSPAIDMIELIAARGNTSLESAVALTKELRYQIQHLGQRLGSAVIVSEKLSQNSHSNAAYRQQHEHQLQGIVADIKILLVKIEDAIPLINLAITTSGATLSTKLPSTISPSRLLQASTFLTAGDTQYSLTPRNAIQIGPTFTLTVYMLFAGHNRPQDEEDIRETTWKEVMHKARVKIRRVPLDIVLATGSGSDALPAADIASKGDDSHAEQDSRIPAEARADEYAYQIMIVEDLDDDRVHDFEEGQPKPGCFDDIQLAGVREVVPVHEISKIFYADTSKVLNIAPESEAHHPVLLLKRDTSAIPPRRMIEKDGNLNELSDERNLTKSHPSDKQGTDIQDASLSKDPWRLPLSLDPEWIALEVYKESYSDEESEEGDHELEPDTPDVSLPSRLERLEISETSHPQKIAAFEPAGSAKAKLDLETAEPPPWINLIKTSLSLLELLLRLTSLQQFQQASHLSITDELLNFFLEESATTGAGGDEVHRQELRSYARRRVGWDPYDESPLKRRGEDYQERGTPNTQAYYDDQYYAHQQQHFGEYSRAGTPMRGPNGEEGVWSPLPWQTTARGSTPGSSEQPAQTRSMTTFSPTPSPLREITSGPRPGTVSASVGRHPPSSDAVAGSKNKTDWLKRQGSGNEKQANHPRSGTRRSGYTDEGLGTSPASSRLGR